MKTKLNVAKTREPEKKPEAPAYEPDFEGMYELRKSLPILGVGPAPSADDCRNFCSFAYKRAEKLTEFFALAMIGMDAEGSDFRSDDLPYEWVADSIRLQLELWKLASDRLFDIRREEEDRVEKNLPKTA